MFLTELTALKRMDDDHNHLKPQTAVYSGGCCFQNYQEIRSCVLKKWMSEKDICDLYLNMHFLLNGLPNSSMV